MADKRLEGFLLFLIVPVLCGLALIIGVLIAWNSWH
jgi:hypothetical protein